MASPKHPVSYNDYHLPDIKFRHHPEDAPVATPVIQLLLDRPQHKNSFTDVMCDSLTTAFKLLSSDPRVRCIVLSGTDPTNRFFCAGMDLGAAAQATSAAGAGGAAAATTTTTTPPPPVSPAELARQREAHRDGGAKLSLAIYACTKPVVVALNGHGVGVGVTMSLPCNIRIASSEGKYGFVFARRGINMEACSSYFLPRIVGAGRALQLVTTGATYGAADPALAGLFAEIVAPDAVLPRALEVASDVAAHTSGVAVRSMKDMLYRGAPASPAEAERLESRVFFDLFRGPDAREGIRSFLEKRDPQFRASWEADRPATWPWWQESKEEEAARKRAEEEAKKEAGGAGWFGWLRSKI